MPVTVIFLMNSLAQSSPILWAPKRPLARPFGANVPDAMLIKYSYLSNGFVQLRMVLSTFLTSSSSLESLPFEHSLCCDLLVSSVRPKNFFQIFKDCSSGMSSEHPSFYCIFIASLHCKVSFTPVCKHQDAVPLMLPCLPNGIKEA